MVIAYRTKSDSETRWKGSDGVAPHNAIFVIIPPTMPDSSGVWSTVDYMKGRYEMGFEEAKSLLAKLTEEINSQGNPDNNPDSNPDGNPDNNPDDNPDGADDLSAIKDEIIKLQNSINDMTKQKTALEKENAQLRRKNTELATKTSIPQKSADELLLNLCDTRRVRKD